MDDLILNAKSSTEIESLLNTVQSFSKGIQMKLGIDKCAALFINHGKNPKLDGIEFKNGNIKKSLSSDENYKYRGILEADNIMHTKVKELTERKYIKRLWKILKSKLNGGNTTKVVLNT